MGALQLLQHARIADALHGRAHNDRRPRLTDLAERIVGEMVEHADQADTFVRIDMEGSDYTEETIQMTERLHARWPGRVGTVLQAYLFRTEADAERLVAQGIRIRLCKGARCSEPASIAFADKADTDANYVKLMKRLATSGVFCGMATHDEEIVDAMKQFVAEIGLDKRAFEFQMLYGIRRDLQRQLSPKGLACGCMCRLGRSGTSVLHAQARGTVPANESCSWRRISFKSSLRSRGSGGGPFRFLERGGGGGEPHRDAN